MIDLFVLCFAPVFYLIVWSGIYSAVSARWD